MVDPKIRSRNIGSKRKGANWEITLVDWFRSLGYGAERISKKGTRDEGDVAVDLGRMSIGSTPDAYLIVEAKNVARLSLSDWLRQATEQAKRWTQDRPGKHGWPVVIIKRRQHSTDTAYVVMELGEFVRLLG